MLGCWKWQNKLTIFFKDITKKLQGKAIYYDFKLIKSCSHYLKNDNYTLWHYMKGICDVIIKICIYRMKHCLIQNGNFYIYYMEKKFRSIVDFILTTLNHDNWNDLTICSELSLRIFRYFCLSNIVLLKHWSTTIAYLKLVKARVKR